MAQWKPKVGPKARAEALARIRSGQSNYTREAKRLGVSARAIRFWVDKDIPSLADAGSGAPSVAPSPLPASGAQPSPATGPGESGGEAAAREAAGLPPSGTPPPASGAADAPQPEEKPAPKPMDAEGVLAFCDFALGIGCDILVDHPHVPAARLAELSHLTQAERQMLTPWAPAAIPYVQQLAEYIGGLGALLFGWALVKIIGARLDIIAAEEKRASGDDAKKVECTVKQ